MGGYFSGSSGSRVLGQLFLVFSSAPTFEFFFGGGGDFRL